MIQENGKYLCIDLKCFYASVECVERNLDPLTTPLVVANKNQKGAICLAITPFLKKKGIRNRCRIYEIPNTIYYQIAKPRMKKYIEYSCWIYRIFLQFIAKEDIHVYSIDESFIYVKPYFKLYQMSARQIGQMLINEIYRQTHLIATCGIGTNLFLAKVALDLLAKHSTDRMAYLDESIFCEKLWLHQPLTDFWQIGTGYAKKLHQLNLYTLKDVAHSELTFLFRHFKSDAINLYQHAWGKDFTTMHEIKNYQPDEKQISYGQTLESDYTFQEARMVLKEMVELLTLELVSQQQITDRLYLSITYSKKYPIKPSKISKNIANQTNSYTLLKKEFLEMFDQEIIKNASIRKIRIAFCHLTKIDEMPIRLFNDANDNGKETKLNQTILNIKAKYGKSSILRVMNLQKKATTIKKNKQIGGHNEE